MDDRLNADRHRTVAALESAIAKSERALFGMTRKSARTTLVAKRLKALRVGLAMLESVWFERPCRYTGEDLEAARGVLAGLLPSVERIAAKAHEGSPQRTLVDRRRRAMELAVRAIDGAMAGPCPP